MSERAENNYSEHSHHHHHHKHHHKHHSHSHHLTKNTNGEKRFIFLEDLSDDKSQLLRKESKFSSNIHDDYYRPGIDRLRFILMFLMCIELFSSPLSFDNLSSIFLGFVPITFYMISGYLVLRKSEDRSDRILRTIKRTAVIFAVLVVAYLLVNFFYYRSVGSNIFDAFKSKRVWFNFIVLNYWPFDIGGAIWYVQALLYAYIIIYFLDKWKLLKFDWLISIILIAFAVITGELSGVFNWNIFGYSYISGNFLTRALPYILLGAFMHRNTEKLFKLRRIYYISLITIGLILIALELFVLNLTGSITYTGHFIGMPVVAFAICLLSFKRADNTGFEKKLKMSRFHINCIYYFSQPVSILVAFMLSGLTLEVLSSILSLFGVIGIIIFVISFFFAWIVSVADRYLLKGKRKYKRLKIADIPIQIHTQLNSLQNTEAYETDDPPAFTIYTKKQDILNEQQKSMDECDYEGITYPNYSTAQLENTAIYRKIATKLPEYDGFVFHGSAIAVDGNGYIFTAKSGTGKTTHTKLWLKNIAGSFVINGDKPVIRIIKGKPFVCGTPWMGKERYGCNKIVPLRGICILNRAPENKIEKVEFQQVYPKLIGQCYRPENGELVAKTVNLLAEIGKSVPIYELHCNMNDEAASVAFGGMYDGQV